MADQRPTIDEIEHMPEFDDLPPGSRRVLAMHHGGLDEAAIARACGIGEDSVRATIATYGGGARTAATGPLQDGLAARLRETSDRLRETAQLIAARGRGSVGAPAGRRPGLDRERLLRPTLAAVAAAALAALAVALLLGRGQAPPGGPPTPAEVASQPQAPGAVVPPTRASVPAAPARRPAVRRAGAAGAARGGAARPRVPSTAAPAAARPAAGPPPLCVAQGLCTG